MVEINKNKEIWRIFIFMCLLVNLEHNTLPVFSSQRIMRRLHKYSACYNFSMVDKCILIHVMDVSCMAPRCVNRVKQNGISLYPLPIKNSTRLQKRLNNMKLKNLPNLKYYNLYSKHFTEDRYERDLRS